MMIITLIIILILAIAAYGCWKYPHWIANQMRRSRLSADLLGWLHSKIFDFQMEDPGEIPKQITFVFIGVIIAIALIAMLVAGVNQ